MKKFLFNPLCAGIVAVLFLIIVKLLEYVFYPAGSMQFYDANQELEIITYGLYVLAGVTAFAHIRDFKGAEKIKTFWALVFLWLITLLREMGLQHWLTRHDTTAIKLRFFTNPNNPLHEKIISATLIIAVLGVGLWLLCRYCTRMIKGFFKLNPLYWTIATFGGIGIVSQICDRFPSRYFKATGVKLDENVLIWLKLVEEGGEACLPILFILAFLQYHHLTQQQK